MSRSHFNPLPCRRGLGEAFSLIELLVVIAVLGVLVGILLPVVSSVSSAHAGRVKCAAQLKTIGQAALLYAQEHDNNLLPLRMDPVGDPGGFWYDHLHEYVGRERGREGRFVDGVKVDYPGFNCPAMNTRYAINRISGWNGHGDKGQMPWYLKMGQGFASGRVVELPGGLSRTAWFADPLAGSDGYFLPEYYNAASNNFIGFPHSGAANVLFMDGHVETIKDPSFRENPALLREDRWVHFFGKGP